MSLRAVGGGNTSPAILDDDAPAAPSIIHPSTFSPTITATITPARAHSEGVSPSRILTMRARGSAIVETFRRQQVMVSAENLQRGCNSARQATSAWWPVLEP